MISEVISHYRIVKKLGAGGMGEVYLAEDMELGRKVAIKFLLDDDSALEPVSRKRLILEAQSAAALDHPNICAVYEVRRHENRSFIVMQYVEGETLATRLQREPLKISDALEITIQVADALLEAHSHGIIHRDIKPQNIMITARGQIKLMDFGLAKVIQQGSYVESEAKTQSLLTKPGLLVGTLPYMSPEQVRGQDIDARTDIFSLGVVLYEMASGRQPFLAQNSVDILAAILTRDVPSLTGQCGIPEDLDHIVAKSLAKERGERYQSVNDLLSDLKRLRRRMESETEIHEQTAETVKTVLIRPVDTAVEQTRPVAQRVLGFFTRHRVASASAVIVLLALMGLVIFQLFISSRAIDSIAILPFVNTGADPDVEYLADGVAESLINNLSQLSGLKVMSRASTFRYKGREIDPKAVASDLKVRTLVIGRVEQRGPDLKVSLELIDARDSSQLWGAEYNRKLSNILGLQEEIAREISQKLRLKLSDQDQERVTKRYTDNSEAYQLYLLGRFYWNKVTPDALNKSIEYYNQAIAKDPEYALAYAGLADTYTILAANFVSPEQVIGKARYAATRALEIDSTLAEAHYARGEIAFIYDWDWPVAESELKRALDLNPSYASAHVIYSQFLRVMGRLDEAIHVSRRAQELDPLSPRNRFNVGLTYYFARQYDQALAEYQKTLEIDQNFFYAYLNMGRVYEQKRDYDQAMAMLEKARSISGEHPVVLAEIGRTHAVLGNTVEAAKIIDGLKQMAGQSYVHSYGIAAIYVALGEKDRALEWLERAYHERSARILPLNIDPHFDTLRPDPKCQDLLKRIGLQ